MSDSAFWMMMFVKISVTLITAYFFWKVLEANKRKID
jgi:heme/copper-type cytochrome/quinol oxidase subunit 2